MQEVLTSGCPQKPTTAEKERQTTFFFLAQLYLGQSTLRSLALVVTVGDSWFLPEIRSCKLQLFQYSLNISVE